MSPKSKKKAQKKRGPQAERVKIEGNWTDAVKKALTRQPPEGSPQEKQRK